MRLTFNQTRKHPENRKVFGVFSCNRCSRPARKAGARGDTVPRTKGRKAAFGTKREPLRLESIHITREHRSLADVVQPQQLHGQSLQTNAQTAVRRHTVLVQHGEGLKQLGVHLAGRQLVHLLLIIVDTLTAGGDLQAAEQQVERQRQLRILRIVLCIERTLCGREVG